MLKSKWFLEFTTKNEGSLHTIEEILYSGKTEYQTLEVLRLGSYGKCLVLDGKIQSTEIDEFIYHESLVHPVLLSMDAPSNVLIAGGGEGATIREVLRHPSVQEVWLVDLDPEVVRICEEFLPEWHEGVFKNAKVNVFFDDARSFIRNCTTNFDLVILDLPEPMDEGPATLLYTEEFYREIFARLTDSGSMVTQATSVAVHTCSTFQTILNTVKQVFPIARPFWANIPSFYSPWGFVYASKKYDPLSLTQDELRKKLESIEGLRFYDHEVHTALFTLPKFLKEAIRKEERVNRDADPISFY